MSEANAQPKLAVENNVNPISNIGLRPYRSDNGPNNKWPIALPYKNIDKLSWTPCGLTPKSRRIEGNAGRYMSVPNAAMPNIKDKSTTTLNELMAVSGGDFILLVVLDVR